MGIKDEIEWNGQVYELEWFETDNIKILSNKKVTQVYGFLFKNDEKMVVINHPPEKDWRLPGGGPEPVDKNWKDTIIRESDEEADIILDENSLKIIGYMKVTPKSENCEHGTHYLIRCIGKIIKINGQTEDPAKKIINIRKFIDSNHFLKYCTWGKNGKAQLDSALRAMGKH